MTTQLATQTPTQACGEDRIRVRLDHLPDHFPAEIRKALQNSETCALSDDEVQMYANGQRGGPDNFLVPKGNIIRLIKDSLYSWNDFSFLDDSSYVFFCGTCCTKI